MQSQRFPILLALLVPTALTAQTRYVVAPGNEARFVVREQLASLKLPNDAIGKTSAVTGAIALDRSGKVDPAGSRITVDLRTLTSDEARRDNRIKRRTLVTDSFPTAELVVRELRGLPSRLPESGDLTLTLLGDLTVHGVTRPTTWAVAARVRGDTVSGRATTNVKFGDFNMDVPRVMVVLSIVDDIRLEYDFVFVREPAP
ncbi:MAG: YceI family protein [Gemmatimonadales bacterium]